jgi:uncharacterized protein (DUF433 family)
VFLGSACSGGKSLNQTIGNSNQESINSSKDSEGSMDGLEKAEYGFKADDGCRALYYRMKDDGGQSSEAVARNMQEADKSISYNRVIKNPVPYYGKPVIINGRIIQTVEHPAKDGSFFTDILMSWGNEPVMVSAAVSTPFVKGDRVVVVGALAKHLFLYKTVAQWDMAVPLVIARAVLKPAEAKRVQTIKK